MESAAVKSLTEAVTWWPFVLCLTSTAHQLRPSAAPVFQGLWRPYMTNPYGLEPCSFLSLRLFNTHSPPHNTPTGIVNKESDEKGWVNCFYSLSWPF